MARCGRLEVIAFLLKKAILRIFMVFRIFFLHKWSIFHTYYVTRVKNRCIILTSKSRKFRYFEKKFFSEIFSELTFFKSLSFLFLTTPQGVLGTKRFQIFYIFNWKWFPGCYKLLQGRNHHFSAPKSVFAKIYGSFGNFFEKNIFLTDVFSYSIT